MGTGRVPVERRMEAPPPRDAERIKGTRMDIQENGNEDAKATLISIHLQDDIYIRKLHSEGDVCYLLCYPLMASVPAHLRSDFLNQRFRRSMG